MISKIKSISASPSGQRGLALLYVIGALLALSAIATAVTMMTPSSTITELHENRFNQAYYAAYSGLQYLKAQEVNTEDKYDDIDSFLTSLGSPFQLSGNEWFQFSLSKVDETSYTVGYILGKYVDQNSATQESYVLAENGVRHFTPKASEDSNMGEFVLASYGQKLEVSKDDVITNDTSLYGSGGVSIHQDVTFNDDIKIISGGETLISQGIKFLSASNSICSKKRLQIDSGVVFTGTVSSSDNILLSSGVVINGSVVSGGDVQMDSKAKINGGPLKAKGNINLFSEVVIDGDVYSLGKIECDKAEIKGKIYHLADKTVTGCSAPIELLDSSYVIEDSCDYTVTTPSLKDFATTAGDDLRSSSINPGTYRDVRYDSKKPMVTFTSGDYFFNSLKFESECSLCLDLSSGGAINIFASDYIVIGQKFKVYVKTTSGGECLPMTDVDSKYAANVYTESHRYFRLDREGMWFGSILANGDLQLSQKSKLIGSYASITGQTKIDSTVTVVYVKSGYVLK